MPGEGLHPPLKQNGSATNASSHLLRSPHKSVFSDQVVPREVEINIKKDMKLRDSDAFCAFLEVTTRL